MKYITVIDKTYDDAVRKARAQYGDALRIHSRRDLVVPGGFLWLSKKNRTEIVCYLCDAPKKEVKSEDRAALLKEFEQEAMTPDPTQAPVAEPIVQPEEPAVDGRLEELLVHARTLLEQNDFSKDYIQGLVASLSQEMSETNEIPSIEDFELEVVDKIVASVEVDHESQIHPPRIFVLLGPTGIGKTTTIAKIAALYGTIPPEDFRRKVAIVTLDTFRVGAYEQIASFGSALGIPVHCVQGEEDFYQLLQELSQFELILVDTIGKSPKDLELAVKMQTLLSVPRKGNDVKFYLGISASMKESDICRTLDQFAPFGITSLIVTKTDETQTIGNIVSLCWQRKLPLLFITDGQKVPRDLHKASSAFILKLLRGFAMDFGALWDNQLTCD